MLKSLLFRSIYWTNLFTRHFVRLSIQVFITSSTRSTKRLKTFASLNLSSVISSQGDLVNLKSPILWRRSMHSMLFSAFRLDVNPRTNPSQDFWWVLCWLCPTFLHLLDSVYFQDPKVTLHSESSTCWFSIEYPAWAVRPRTLIAISATFSQQEKLLYKLGCIDWRNSSDTCRNQFLETLLQHPDPLFLVLESWSQLRHCQKILQISSVNNDSF